MMYVFSLSACLFASDANFASGKKLCEKRVRVASLAALVLLKFGILLDVAQLHHMSGQFRPSAAVFSPTSSASVTFSLASPEAQRQVVQRGIDYDNHVSGQRVISEKEIARLRNVAYTFRVEAESQPPNMNTRRTVPCRLTSPAGSDNEEADYEAETYALSPDVGRPRLEANSVTSPGWECTGEETFFGIVFGSGNAFTTPKARTREGVPCSPLLSFDEASPDLGRDCSLHSPSETPDNEDGIYDDSWIDVAYSSMTKAVPSTIIR
jgi:hypothetical protein